MAGVEEGKRPGRQRGSSFLEARGRAGSWLSGEEGEKEGKRLGER